MPQFLLCKGVNWNLIKTDGASSCMNATTGGTQRLLEMQIHSSLDHTFHASKVIPQNLHNMRVKTQKLLKDRLTRSFED